MGNNQESKTFPKAQQIVAMALSAAGLASATGFGTGYVSFNGGSLLVLSMEAVALSVVGYIMSQNGLRQTDSIFLRLGKYLGLGGIIAGAVSYVLCVLLLFWMFALMFAAGILQEVM